jgi:colanic acid biosynthesis glycosyl transferase WcaI
MPRPAATRALHVQLWTCYFDPEPTGIAPVCTVWANGLRERGHTVEVVAAHPHYPEPRWGKRVFPYRDSRGGIPVTRLPIWIGRDTPRKRIRQELSFAMAQLAAAPWLQRPDVLVAVSPSFPALLPAVVSTRYRRIPWILWLQDILPDGAQSTGLVNGGAVLRLSRQLERAAYRAADRIVVLTQAFKENLLVKGVDRPRIQLIANPATRTPRLARSPDTNPTRILSMGNIGLSQGLAPLVRAFDRSDQIGEDVRLIITGHGVAAGAARAEITTRRVEMLGLVDDARLEHELTRATFGLVSQNHRGGEFNVPSKLMNFMAYGLPVLAAVDPASEVARIVEQAGAGWVLDSRRPDEFPTKLVEVMRDRTGIEHRAAAARSYAERNFTQEQFVARFERSLLEVAERGKRRPSR